MSWYVQVFSVETFVFTVISVVFIFLTISAMSEEGQWFMHHWKCKLDISFANGMSHLILYFVIRTRHTHVYIYIYIYICIYIYQPIH